MENGYIESFNGKFRDECLNENWFGSLPDARRIIEAWRVHYNERRPHSALGYLTPAQYAARGEALRSHDSSAPRPLAATIAPVLENQPYSTPDWS